MSLEGDMKELGKMTRALRGDLEWTQEDFCLLIGIDQPKLSLFERGRHSLPSKNVKMFIHLLEGIPSAAVNKQVDKLVADSKMNEAAANVFREKIHSFVSILRDQLQKLLAKDCIDNYLSSREAGRKNPETSSPANKNDESLGEWVQASSPAAQAVKTVSRRLGETNSFPAWLKGSAYARPNEIAKQLLEHIGSRRICCGDCIILAAPASAAGFRDIVPTNFANAVKWAVSEPPAELGEIEFWKACPVCVDPPISFDPSLRLQYVAVPGKWARDFGQSFRNHSRQRSDFAKDALRLDRINNLIPGIICLHVLVLLRDLNTGDRYMLLAQRRSRNIGYYSSAWCCSIEEQYRPRDGMVDNRIEPRDETIHGCAMRGVYEELWDDPSLIPNIETHAYFLEADLLSPAFLALAEWEIPSLEMFKNGLDENIHSGHEHQSIVAIPCKRESVEILLGCERLSKEVFDKLDGRWLRNSPDNVDKWEWHPSSKLRLALALWKLL